MHRCWFDAPICQSQRDKRQGEHRMGVEGRGALTHSQGLQALAFPQHTVHQLHVVQ